MNEPKIQQIDLESIRTDEECQGRVSLNPGAVKEYAELAKSGTRLPPLTVFYDGAEYWLADGFHRIQAYRRNKTLRVNATIMAGDRTDARLYAAGANATHGLRRSNADKRKAVGLCLDALTEKGEEWSERKVAKHCGVTNHLVADVRAGRGEREKSPSRKTIDARAGVGNFPTLNPASDSETPFLQESDDDAMLDANAEAEIEEGWIPDAGETESELTDREKIALSEIGEDGIKRFDAPPEEVSVAESDSGEPKADRGLSEYLIAMGKETRTLGRQIAATAKPLGEIRTRGSWVAVSQEVIDAVKLAAFYVRNAAPYAACPYCVNAGKLDRSCRSCEGMGAVGKQMFDKAPGDYKAKVEALDGPWSGLSEVKGGEL